MSPLALPGVCGSATSSVLNSRIVSMVLRPMAPMTSSTAILACVIESMSRNSNCPLNFANCSMATAAPFSSRLRMWYSFFAAAVSFRGNGFGESIVSNRLRHRRLTFN